MSCPSCQVAGRRLPPFPSSYINKSQNRLSKNLDPAVNDSGFPLKPLRSEKDFLVKMQTENQEVDCELNFHFIFKVFCGILKPLLF